MSNFYPYNPWIEAAQLGEGVARGLGESFVNAPRERYMLARQQAQDALQMQELQANQEWRRQQQTWQAQEQPLRLQLLTAQAAQAQQMPEILNERLTNAQEALRQREDLNNSIIALNQAREQHLTNSGTTPAQQREAFGTMQNDVIPTVLSRAGVPPMLDDKKRIIAPSLYPVDASQAGSYGTGLLNSGASVEDVINSLQAVPETQTNNVFSISHPFTGAPQVVTNKMVITPKVKPASAKSVQQSGGYAKPQTQEEYDKLEPNTVYIDTDGQIKRKK